MKLSANANVAWRRKQELKRNASEKKEKLWLKHREFVKSKRLSLKDWRRRPKERGSKKRRNGDRRKKKEFASKNWPRKRGSAKSKRKLKD